MNQVRKHVGTQGVLDKWFIFIVVNGDEAIKIDGLIVQFGVKAIIERYLLCCHACWPRAIIQNVDVKCIVIAVIP